MIDYHDCGLQLQAEYRDDGDTLMRVYYYDDRPVTDCPMCGAPLTTDVMQPDPDEDSFLWVDLDPDLVPPFTVPG